MHLDTDACPSWCTREHASDDHPEDRRHQSTPATVELITAADQPPRAGQTLVEVAVYLDQPGGASAPWVRIESLESAEIRVAMTPVAAARLVASLRATTALAADEA